MFRFNFVRFSACAALLFGANLIAGGFWLQIGNPIASHDAKAKNAVLVARPWGCHSPEAAKVSGTAEGIVNGQRKTITLDLVALSETASYAVMRQWPSEGAWVVRLTAALPGLTTSALVPIGSDGFDRGNTKFFAGEPPAADLDAMLHTMAAQQVAARR